MIVGNIHNNKKKIITDKDFDEIAEEFNLTEDDIEYIEWYDKYKDLIKIKIQ